MVVHWLVVERASLSTITTTGRATQLIEKAIVRKCTSLPSAIVFPHTCHVVNVANAIKNLSRNLP